MAKSIKELRMNLFKIIIFIPLFLSSCTPMLKWQTEYPDNYAEELIENLIESKTGKQIDLTPITGEERQKLN